MNSETELQLAALVIRFPRALIAALPSGRWFAQTRWGLITADDAHMLGELLEEIYGEPCQVIPLHESDMRDSA